MRILGLFSVLVICLTVPTGNASASDLRKGFSGIEWGTDLSVSDEFIRIRSREEVTFYRPVNKIYTIFDVDVSDVVFGSYDEKFFAVYMRIDSVEVFGRLKSHLISTFGKPETRMSLKNKQTIHKWEKGDIKIKLKVRENGNLMKLGFYYTPISGSINEAEQESFIENSPNFFPIERDKVPERIPVFRF